MDELLQDLQSKYSIVRITSNSDEDVFRSSISSKEEAENFVKDFGRVTKSEWIVKTEVKNPVRSVFHKIWLCQHSKKNKKSDNYRNAYCSAYLNIYVKKNTVGTRAKDEYLQKDPPLPAIIKLQPKHSHSIDTVHSLQMRRVSDETKAKFVKYFENGMKVSEARSFHAKQIRACGNSDESLADAALNPTFRQVIYLYDSWKKGSLQRYVNYFDKAIKKDEALEVRKQQELADLVDDFYENLDEDVESISSQESDSSNDELELITKSEFDEALEVQKQEEMTNLVHDYYENLDEVMESISSQESDSSSDESELITESKFGLQETVLESSVNNPTLSSSATNNTVPTLQTSQTSLSNNFLNARMQGTAQTRSRYIYSGRNASRCVAKKRITVLHPSFFKSKRETSTIQQLLENNSLLQKVLGTLERIEKSLTIFNQTSHLMCEENERLESISRSLEQSARTFEVFSSLFKEIVENR